MSAHVGLEARAPEKGRAADCYAVARTALLLHKDPADAGERAAIARHASELHRISGALHRIGEHEYNGYRTAECVNCAGTGYQAEKVECRKCAGYGDSHWGPRKARLKAAADSIATHYGLRCYFQTDPRGCALYLIDPADVPSGDDLRRSGDYTYPSDRPDAEGFGVSFDTLQARWIESNYNRGHAVTRLGA